MVLQDLLLLNKYKDRFKEITILFKKSGLLNSFQDRELQLCNFRE